LVFRLFGLYSAGSAIVILGIQCIIAAATGIAIHALGRRMFGPQIFFWSSPHGSLRKASFLAAIVLPDTR
jgi:hypothetical protein